MGITPVASATLSHGATASPFAVAVPSASSGRTAVLTISGITPGGGDTGGAADPSVPGWTKKHGVKATNVNLWVYTKELAAGETSVTVTPSAVTPYFYQTIVAVYSGVGQVLTAESAGVTSDTLVGTESTNSHSVSVTPTVTATGAYVHRSALDQATGSGTGWFTDGTMLKQTALGGGSQGSVAAAHWAASLTAGTPQTGTLTHNLPAWNTHTWASAAVILLPYKTLRFYLPNSGTALTPQPARDTDWSGSNGTTLREMTTTPGSSTNASSPGQSSNLAVDWRQRTHEFVTPVLPSSIKIVAVRSAIRGEHWLGGDKAMVLNARLIGADYQTPGATVVDMAQAPTTTTAGTTVRTISAAASTVVGAGARMHVELGGKLFAGTASGAGQYIEIGETGSDLPFTNGSTATGRGWVEIDYEPGALAPGVNVVEYKKFETAAQNAGSFSPFTLDTTPQPGDVILIAFNDTAGPYTPSLAGASFSRYRTGESSVASSPPVNDMRTTWFISRDATAGGNVLLNPNTTMRGSVHMWLLRSSTAAFISVLARSQSSLGDSVTSLSRAVAPAKVGDLVLGMMYWNAASGTPSMTSSHAFTGSSGAVFDSLFNETWAAWRRAEGDESVTLTTARTTAAKGLLGALLVTDNLQAPTTPSLTQYYGVPIDGAATTSFGVYFDAHAWAPSDLIVVLQSMTSEADPDEYVASGLGATWAKTIISSDVAGRTVMWVGKGMTSTGMINLSHSPISTGYVVAFAVRGAQSSVVKYATAKTANATERGNFTGPSVVANTGELVVAHRYHIGVTGGNSVTFPATKTPNDSSWVTGFVDTGSVNGSSQVSRRVATADAQTHQVSTTNTNTSVDEVITMLRIGVMVEKIVASSDAVSDLVVTLRKPVKRLAVRMDSTWSANLFDDSTDTYNKWDPGFDPGYDAEQYVTLIDGPGGNGVMIQKVANEASPMVLYPKFIDMEIADVRHPIRISRWSKVVPPIGGSASALSTLEVNTASGEQSGARMVKPDNSGYVPDTTILSSDGWRWDDNEGSVYYDYYGVFFLVGGAPVWYLNPVTTDVVNVLDGTSTANWTATEQPFGGSQSAAPISVLTWGVMGSMVMFGDTSGTFTTARATYGAAISKPSGKSYLAIELMVEDNSGYDASLLIDALHVKTPVQIYSARERGDILIFDLSDRDITTSLQVKIVAASTMYRFGIADISWVPWPLNPARLYVAGVEVREKLTDRAPLALTIAPRRIAASVDSTSDLKITFPTDWKLTGPEANLEVDLSRTISATSDATSELFVTLRGLPIILDAHSDLDVTLSTFLEPVELDTVSDLEVTLSYPPLPTDTTNRVGGRHRGGYGVATWSPAIVPRPQSAYGATAVREDLQYMVAAAFGPVTMQGTQPVYSVSAAHAPRARQRILVGGKDITYFRNKITPDVGYQHAEPLLHGPGQLNLPQVSAAFEKPGVGALKWLKPGKPVIVQRVLDGVVVDEDYKGIVIAWEPDGKGGLSVELGGEAAGRAGLIDKQLPIFRDVLDIGRLAWRAIKDLGLPFQPRMGPVTGIESATWGGMAHLDYIAELVTKGWTRSGAQWTIMPDAEGVYRMQRKDLETVHFTVFTDETRNAARLRRDMAEEPNRIFMSGVTPAGQRVRFGAYPGLKQGRRAPYPFADNRNFGPGTTNEMTDNGDGISVMVNRLWVCGFLSLAEYPGGYDGDVAKAVAALKDRAGIATGFFGPSETVMTPATWRALWDLDATGYSLRGSAIQPAAQRSYTRRYRRSGTGAIIGKNKNYDKHRLPVDATYDAGSGHRRGQLREWAETELVREDNYYGTITLKTGAVLAGFVDKGATVTPGMLMDNRAIRPGMNAWLPMHAGGLLVHVSGVDVASDTVTLTVDTQARDAAKVWEVITRNKETRNDPARRWRGNRASTEIKDSIDVWDEVGGTLDNDVDLVAGWNVIKVVTGQAGTISRIRLIVQTVTGGEVISIDGKEYACAVFGDKVTVRKLQHLVPAPLTAAGTKRWQNKRVSKSLRKLGLLYAAGTSEEPCGYSPGRKHTKEREVEQPNPDYNPETGSDSDKVVTVTVSESWGTVTGMHDDDAGFGYNRYGAEPVLYLAVWVDEDTTLKGGRIMWNQLETGA